MCPLPSSPSRILLSLMARRNLSVSGRAPRCQPMRHWLTRCLLERKRCARRTGNQEDMFLPTRLINVGTASEPGLNLVLSAELPRSRRSQHITLSSCWGSGGHSALTTALNLGERYLHIDMECLPKTFQDAIEITRQLKIHTSGSMHYASYSLQ
jgi:hypothetical protein